LIQSFFWFVIQKILLFRPAVACRRAINDQKKKGNFKMPYRGDSSENIKKIQQHIARQSDSQQQQALPDYMQLVEKYQRENKCSKFEAIVAVCRSHPDSRRAYLEKFN